MTLTELLELHIKLSHKAYVLTALKNHDYAPSDLNPFSSFDRKGLEGITTRMGDKLARLEAFAMRGVLRVETETVEDTVLDMINYSILYYGYIEHKKTKS